MEEKRKVKIGEVMTCQEEFQIEAPFSGKKLNVKAGDKCIVRSDKAVQYLDGECRGKLQALSDNFMVLGYDNDSIAQQIIKEIKLFTPLNEMMEDYGASKEEFKEAIVAVLENILQ